MGSHFGIGAVRAQERQANMKVPQIGDIIYVRGAMSMGHGHDDYEGGMATVSAVKQGISGGASVNFVSVEEIPNRSFNWDQFLANEQDELAQQYGTQIAHPDPMIVPNSIEAGEICPPNETPKQN